MEPTVTLPPIIEVEPMPEEITEALPVLEPITEPLVFVEPPVKREKPKPEVHDAVWRARYDRAWNERREANFQANVKIFHGHRATSNGVTFFEHGQGGRQSKHEQRKNHGRGR